MQEALKQARIAMDEGEVPVGAVIVCENRIVARGHNQVEKLNDPTAHAEMIAITSAADAVGSKFLEECAIYVTLEPCAMCAGALSWARVKSVYYGTSDLKKGYSLYSNNILHPKTEVVEGILEDECTEILNTFFQRLRKD